MHLLGSIFSGIFIQIWHAGDFYGTSPDCDSIKSKVPILIAMTSSSVTQCSVYIADLSFKSWDAYINLIQQLVPQHF